jgi:hypothetical protein
VLIEVQSDLDDWMLSWRGGGECLGNRAEAVTI